MAKLRWNDWFGVLLAPTFEREKNMTYFIDDPRKWRLSKSGFSIKTGWADEKKIIAKYPGALSPLDAKEFQEWMDNVERICELHNATISD